MLISRKQSIEDIIIEKLAKNPYIDGVSLVSLVKEVRSKTTKQAVYIALQNLKENEIVAKVKDKYFLTRIWLSKVNQLFKNKEQLTKDAIFDLKEGESISYHFPSLYICDTYWAHVFNLLIEWTPENRPIFVWNPHQWFAIARNDVETNIFKEYIAKNKKAYYLIPGNQPLDQEFARTWKNPNVSIAIGDKTSFAHSYYLNVFDDFIIEVFVDMKLANSIERFYVTHPKLTPEGTLELEQLIAEKHPIRMKISRKKEKAFLLRKKLSKNFLIPKTLEIK